MNKARRQLQMEGESVECPAAMESEIVESPATLVVSPFVATEEGEVSFQEYAPAAMESESVESPATLVVSPFVATEESEVSFQEYVPEQHPNTPAFSSTSIDFAS